MADTTGKSHPPVVGELVKKSAPRVHLDKQIHQIDCWQQGSHCGSDLIKVLIIVLSWQRRDDQPFVLNAHVRAFIKCRVEADEVPGDLVGEPADGVGWVQTHAGLSGVVLAKPVPHQVVN
ncbi:MAG: hypothetical protein P1T08_18545 [Acidimicrobiia bacterium]|nr:hypothetical protein [Acidimicrobiia bacterium]